jgi:hypothetical protein
MIADLAHWIGSHWGRTDDAIVCEQCGWEDPTDTYLGDTCPECGTAGHLVVAVTNGMRWEITYLLWKSEQKWWPQRYCLLAEQSEQYWWWLGRRWRVRPWAGL